MTSSQRSAQNMSDPRIGPLIISKHETLLELEPITYQAVQLRNPYVDPLNYTRWRRSRRLRALADPEDCRLRHCAKSWR